MQHGSNVIRFLITTGQCGFFVIGAYIPPADVTTFAHIQTICGQFTDMPMILMGDLNVDLYGNPPDNHAIEIFAFISSLGLEDMASHFLQKAGYHHGDTWQLFCDGQLISSCCDYILATDRMYFRYVGHWEPCYNSDHLMVEEELCQQHTGKILHT
jgi:hypothetical protein